MQNLLSRTEVNLTKSQDDRIIQTGHTYRLVNKN